MKTLAKKKVFINAVSRLQYFKVLITLVGGGWWLVCAMYIHPLCAFNGFGQQFTVCTIFKLLYFLLILF